DDRQRDVWHQYRQKEQRAVQREGAHLGVENDRDGQGADDARRNRKYRVEQSVGNRTADVGVVEEVCVILNPDESGRHHSVIIGEAVPERGDDWVRPEGEETYYPGSAEGDPHQRVARRGRTHSSPRRCGYGHSSPEASDNK